MAIRMDESAHGVYVISVTPFTDDGAVDWGSLESLVEFYIGCGVHGITLLGMMGEAHKLSSDESVQLVERALHGVAGRVPVVVGVSSGGIAPLRSLAMTAMDAGAASVMVAPPAGLRTDDQILGYYRQVAAALGPDVPFIYQDYPQSTAVYLSASLFARLADAVPSLVMLKLEDCPGLDKLSRIRAEAASAGRRRVSILAGNGGLYFPQFLRRGADGAMTGFAYPDVLAQVYERFAAGDAEGAADLYDRFLPLIAHEQQPGFGLALRKEMLRRRGAIACAAARQPGPALTAADRAELDRLLARVEKHR
ncbi:MAG: dihydrodipicolinate synthase family protein [Vicinamibacterales bacterium]|nr:dihydrodipicolinate synthase family protein [Vicinamibacterales bacterium]